MLLRPTNSKSVFMFADQASRGGKSLGQTALPQCKDAVSTVCNNRSRTALSKIRCCPQMLFLMDSVLQWCMAVPTTITVFLSVFLALRAVWYRCSSLLNPQRPNISPSSTSLCATWSPPLSCTARNSVHYSAAHWSTWTVAIQLLTPYHQHATT